MQPKADGGRVRTLRFFRNLCEEDNGVKLNDGTTKMFLSTKGEKDDVSNALKNFLDYVDGHAPADELMKEIDTEVMTAKSCDEWRREYMTLKLEIEKEKKLSRAEGLAEGEARGLAKGKIKNVKDMLKAGLVTLEAIKASGLYSKQEIEAIMAP